MKTSDRFPEFKSNPPTTADRIREFEKASGIHLRGDYVEFLMESNGGEGFIGEGYAMLWRLEYLIEMNERYNVSKHAPGLFLFGSDGGGEAFAFDLRFTDSPIVSVPFIPLTLADAIRIAEDFGGFVRYLSSGSELPGL